MKTALISSEYDSNNYRVGENLGVKYLCSYARKFGYHVDVFEPTLDFLKREELINIIKNNKYSIVGISVQFTDAVSFAVDLAKSIKGNSENIKIVLGGQGICFIWEELLNEYKFIDFCISFEGERTFIELLESIKSDIGSLSDIKGLYYRRRGEVIFNGHRDPIENLDILPFPIREKHSNVLGQNHYMMISSRGCNGTCTFCISGNYGNKYHKKKKWRSRSAENIIAEIDYLVDKYNAEAISFVDDSFLGGSQDGSERVLEFTKMLSNKNYNIKWSIECRVDHVSYSIFKKMKAVGLAHVFVGIDSGNEEDLKLYAKKYDLSTAVNAVNILNKLKISFDIGFIMFNPISNLQKIKKNLTFLKKINFTSYRILTNQLELYNGTSLIDYFKKMNLVKKMNYKYRCEYLDFKIYLLRYLLCNCLKKFIQYENEINRAFFLIQIAGRDTLRKIPEYVENSIINLSTELKMKEIYFAENIVSEVETREVEEIRRSMDYIIDKYLVKVQNFLDPFDHRLHKVLAMVKKFPNA